MIHYILFQAKGESNLPHSTLSLCRGEGREGGITVAFSVSQRSRSAEAPLEAANKAGSVTRQDNWQGDQSGRGCLLELSLVVTRMERGTYEG